MDVCNKRKRLARQAGEDEKMEGCHDIISNLPDECITYVFNFLTSTSDRCSCAAVSKRWLHLLATMQSYKLNPYTVQDQELSRCLDDDKANDTRLAAVLVGAYSLGVLTELSVRATTVHPPGITNSGLKIVALACSNLKVLVLWNCIHVGDEGLTSIANGCRTLEKLDLSNSPSVGDDGLIGIATHCPMLSTLSLESCQLIGTQSLKAFSKPSSKLNSITLVRCPRVGDTGIVSIISTLPKLARLKLRQMKLGSAVFKAIAESGKKLRVLWLDKVWCPSEMGFSWIGAAEGLESLTLSCCIGLTSRSFEQSVTNNFAQLKKLCIRNSNVLELMKATPLLEILALEHCGGLTHRGLMQALANCSKTLKKLSLVKCNISGNQEAETPPLTEEYPLPLPLLHELKITSCSGVGDSFLARMGGACRRVRHITVANNMGGAMITDRGLLALLRPFDGRKEVQSLDLSGCGGVSDWCMVAITRECGRALRSLRLEGCKGLTDRYLGTIGMRCRGLRELDLSGCEISDGGLCRVMVETPPDLQVLSLAGCVQITDRSLGVLELMCCGLEMLNLKRCPGLTQRGIDSVKETLFWCDVIC